MLGFIKNRFGNDREYQVLLEVEEDGTFAATSPALPGFVAYGASEASAVRKLRRAIRRNLEGFAKDYVRVSSADSPTSRHKSALHFRLPLTTTAKVVLTSVAAVSLLALLALELRRRRD
ncbi:MAG TPA: type II toxin-antitoxin system HicB family antitoxin [Gemmatimonadota bacterium]|nr:type II toxin-antitoxin system HicB family antitoxin [Gemmatimonadota bacterium]